MKYKDSMHEVNNFFKTQHIANISVFPTHLGTTGVLDTLFKFVFSKSLTIRPAQSGVTQGPSIFHFGRDLKHL